MAEFMPKNQDKDEAYNREPGVTLVPGSNFLKETAKFEQFPTKFTMGTKGPGNPYVKREFPKMLFRAENYNGAIRCMAAPIDPYDPAYRNANEIDRAERAAYQFNLKCQRTVGDDREQQRAMEDGWRESPTEAVDYLEGRERDHSTAAAERIHADRNMSPEAKAEVEKVIADSGGAHVASMPEAPVKRRRGRPMGSKNKPKG